MREGLKAEAVEKDRTIKAAEQDETAKEDERRIES